MANHTRCGLPQFYSKLLMVSLKEIIPVLPGPYEQKHTTIHVEWDISYCLAGLSFLQTATSGLDC